MESIRDRTAGQERLGEDEGVQPPISPPSSIIPEPRHAGCYFGAELQGEGAGVCVGASVPMVGHGAHLFSVVGVYFDDGKLTIGGTVICNTWWLMS